MMETVKRYGFTLGLALLWAAVCFVAAPARIDGSSMSPEFQDGHWVWALYFKRLDPGFPRFQEVVVFHPPGEAGIFGFQGIRYIKRVLGLPGDRIEIRDGTLYRNGKAVTEPYRSSVTASTEMPGIVLKKDEYFLVGDNRILGASIDSRQFGPVQRSNILGQVIH